MITKDLQEKYIKDKGFSYFNANQQTEYSIWLEEELIEARKQLNKLRLAYVSQQREMLVEFMDEWNTNNDVGNNEIYKEDIDSFLATNKT